MVQHSRSENINRSQERGDDGVLEKALRELEVED